MKRANSASYMKEYMKKYRAVLAGNFSSSSSQSDFSEEMLEDSESNNSKCSNNDFPMITLNSSSHSHFDSSEEIDPFESSSSENGDTCLIKQTVHEFLSDLTKWAVKCKLQREYFDELLNLIRISGRFHQEDIPKDSCTLLRTPRKVNVVDKCNGKYVYLGLRKGILSIIQKSVKEIRSVEVDINIDGLPVHKSSNLQFWPILCRVVGLIDQPFVVALYSGNYKPSHLDQFLSDFVNEANYMHQNGISINNMELAFRVRSFICDAPARAFIKCVAGHTAKFGCERCTVEATSENHRIVYLKTGGKLRTDIEFRKGCYPNHKLSDSPLLQLNGIDIIKDFPLDSMHLVFLGVCKRFLCFLKSGPRNVRLSFSNIESISKNLLNISECTPSQFARRPRSLLQLERWKATEFRQFVLYTGMVVLKNKISKDLYDLFLAFSIAIKILHIENFTRRNSLLPFTQDLLETFVANSKVLCGQSFVTYNIHNLLHIVDDVKYFSCTLAHISCFPFENYLQHLKRIVQGAKNNPVVSAVRRIEEHAISNVINCHKEYKEVKISLQKRDKFFIDVTGNYCETISFNGNGETQLLICKIVHPKKLKSFFDQPINSRELGILYCSDIEKEKRKIVKIKRCDVAQKLYAMKYLQNGIIFVPVESVID